MATTPGQTNELRAPIRRAAHNDWPARAHPTEVLGDFSASQPTHSEMDADRARSPTLTKSES